jgi:hypothetical protein
MSKCEPTQQNERATITDEDEIITFGFQLSQNKIMFVFTKKIDQQFL